MIRFLLNFFFIFSILFGVAFCENVNKGLQPNCRVCKRDKEASLKRKELEELEKLVQIVIYIVVMENG